MSPVFKAFLSLLLNTPNVSHSCLVGLRALLSARFIIAFPRNVCSQQVAERYYLFQPAEDFRLRRSAEAFWRLAGSVQLISSRRQVLGCLICFIEPDCPSGCVLVGREVQGAFPASSPSWWWKSTKYCLGSRSGSHSLSKMKPLICMFILTPPQRNIHHLRFVHPQLAVPFTQTRLKLLPAPCVLCMV